MKTKRYRGGFKSRCHFKCKHNCSHTCKQLCAVSKQDKAFHHKAISELILEKEGLKKQIEQRKDDSIDKLLKNDELSDKEKGDLRKILEGDTSASIKNLLKSGFQQAREGGFSWLNFRKKHNECEKDCEEKCYSSCDYLCDESVNIKASAYNKEISMLRSEIAILKSVLNA